MRILVDKNIPNITVQGLRGIGHDVRDIRGTPDQGMDDDRLWELAQKEQRLLEQQTSDSCSIGCRCTTGF